MKNLKFSIQLSALKPPVAILPATLLLSCLISSFQTMASGSGSHIQPHLQFFAELRAYCGQVFSGKSSFPDDPTHDFAGKTLQATIATCSEREIRIPFKVGEDQSRTWVISLTAQGLLLKHDHRHKDGAPHKVTEYGGYATASGTRYVQNFPADEFTQTLIPEARTNVWQLTLDPKQQTLTYYLSRHDKPRYKAVLSHRQTAKSRQMSH